MPAPVLFSVAIPAFNEAQYLPRLLDSLDAARARYHGGADAIEIIIGDNRSTDSTAALAAARGCTVVDVEKRAIAAARNGAARAARGEILCFVDADSIVHPETFNEIDRVMRTGRCAVGATGVKMERMSVGIWATWALMVPMTRVFGMDSGVVFCRRADFEAVGGYREELLAAEDVDFLHRVKRLGRRRGQRFMRTAGARTITSTRKFDRHGDWHYLTQMSTLPFRMLFARASAMRKIRHYWYEDRS
jgi:glycosyltransferase involved in cell wall biosynthesis